MQSIIAATHQSLIKKHKTIAVAESCTGGLLSGLLTALSKSSAYFLLGTVVYSNKMKNRILSIPISLIAKKGAVSREVAGLMAEKVRKLAGADFGIGISGIAGPGGGSKIKPVGTVFIGLAGKNKKICQEFHFKGNRATVRKKAALKSLALLRSYL